MAIILQIYQFTHISIVIKLKEKQYNFCKMILIKDFNNGCQKNWPCKTANH